MADLSTRIPTLKRGEALAAAVPDAAGSTPTDDEFKALLDSLRDAGVIAES